MIRGKITIFSPLRTGRASLESQNFGSLLKGGRAVATFRKGTQMTQWQNEMVCQVLEDDEYMVPEGTLIETIDHRFTEDQGIESKVGPTYAVVWCRRWKGEGTRLMKFRLATLEEYAVLEVMTR